MKFWTKLQKLRNFGKVRYLNAKLAQIDGVLDQNVNSGLFWQSQGLMCKTGFFFFFGLQNKLPRSSNGFQALKLSLLSSEPRGSIYSWSFLSPRASTGPVSNHQEFMTEPTPFTVEPNQLVLMNEPTTPILEPSQPPHFPSQLHFALNPNQPHITVFRAS